MTWIVMTSSASMPASCKGRYRVIGLVQLTDEYAASGQIPKMISDRAKGVAKVQRLGPYHVGETERGAYQKALAEANQLVERRNKGEA
jgi:hypothetical protein